MNLPFLTNSQIEELDSFGYIEVTEDLIEDLMNWCRNPEKIYHFNHTQHVSTKSHATRLD